MQRKRRSAEETRAYWFMIAPATLLYFFVMAFPIALSIILSLSNYSSGQMFGGDPWHITGFSSYTRLFHDPLFWNALQNNMYIVLVSVFGQLPLGFIFAYIIYRKLVRWPGFWQGILYVPNIISVIVIALLWNMIFSPAGPLADFINATNVSIFSSKLTSLIHQFGGVSTDDNFVKALLALGGPQAAANFTDPIPELKDFLSGYVNTPLPQTVKEISTLFVPKWNPEFLNQQGTAMLPILFVILWMYTGFYIILFLANLQKISSEVIEAARIDGAHEGQTLVHIILPALSGTLVNAAILAIAGSLSSFALIFAMTGGGPTHYTEILAIYMYNTAFTGKIDYPLANAIALVMVLISFILIMITKIIEKRYGGQE